MDFLVVSAITTIQLQEVLHAAVPFLLSCAVGICWTLVAYLLFARLLPDYWAERAITEVGLSLVRSRFPLAPLRNWLFTPELQWQPRGK
jgi:Na+/glutamate symporter